MSRFGDRFEEVGITELVNELGDSVTYTVAATGSTSTIDAIFNEFVGALDEFGNAIFTIQSSDVSSPQRGDTITLASNVWTVLDVRSDNAGGHELRVVIPQVIS